MEVEKMVSRQERKEASIRKFLEAAEDLLLERGYEGTTIQAILDHTGLSKGAFYHYFASKDQLFWELAQVKANKIREEFWNSVSTNGGLLEPTQVMIRNTLAFSMDPVIKIIYSHYLSIASHNQEAARRIRDFHELWRTLAEESIGAAKKAGLVPQDLDVQQVSVLVLAVTMGLGLQMAAEKERFSFDEYVNALQSLVLYMFQSNDFKKSGE
jgi:AcrR family transcriptional regulator